MQSNVLVLKFFFKTSTHARREKSTKTELLKSERRRRSEDQLWKKPVEGPTQRFMNPEFIFASIRESATTTIHPNATLVPCHWYATLSLLVPLAISELKIQSEDKSAKSPRVDIACVAHSKRCDL